MSKIKRFEFTNILGWSVSRYDKFSSCKRQYYYDYYGKHDKEYPFSKIGALKQMTSSALEGGNIVHDSIKALLERLLKSEKPIDRKKFLEFARKMTEENCGKKTFSEVYYGEIGNVDKDALFALIKSSLENFLDSDRFAWILGKAIERKNEWVIEPGGYGETRINEMKAYCKVDFLLPFDSHLYILDWKTGRQDAKKHGKQLIGYSLWASYHFGKKSEEIIPITVYLRPSYSELKLSFKDSELNDFVETVKNETVEMYGFCRDVEKNLPKNKDEFPIADNKMFCRFCNYKELCA